MRRISAMVGVSQIVGGSGAAPEHVVANAAVDVFVGAT